MLIQNTADLKSQNIKKIISYLRRNEHATRKEIADHLNLSFPAVANLCNQLIADKFLQTISSANSSGGRIPDLLYINPEVKYILCLNIIGVRTLEIGILNLKNELVYEKKFDVSEGLSFEDSLQFYCKCAKEMIGSAAIGGDKILGMGVAISGKYNKSNGVVISSHNTVYDNKPLKTELEKLSGMPVYMENETSLIALWVSSEQNVGLGGKNIVYLYFGEGFGSAIISDGKLISGARGLGGEMDHLPIGDRHYPCYCGKSGCIETELTAEGFLKKYEEYTKADGGHHIVWKSFVEKVYSNDEAAMRVIKENGNLIGKLVSILVNLFDPDAIYIGGFTESIFDYLLPYTLSEAKERLSVKGISDIHIVNSKDYERLIFKGCGEFVYNNWVF